MRLSFALVASVLISAAGLTADLNDGLIAYFPFSGDAQDASGNGNHGTVNGASLAPDRLGNADSAYLFDGTDDYIIVEDNIPLRLSGTDFSLSVWAYETQRNTAFQDALLTKRGPLQQDGWFFSLTGLQSITPSGPGRVFFQMSGGDDPRVFSSSVIPLNIWVHMTVTYDLTEHLARIYIDGNLAAVSASLPSPNPATDNDMCIGRDSQGLGYHFHGKIDEARIYNRRLAEAEILELAGVLGDLTAPETLSVIRSGDIIHLSWEPVPTATSYSVFSSSDPSLPHDNWTLAVSGLDTPQWSVAGAEKMFFFVRAYR